MSRPRANPNDPTVNILPARLKFAIARANLSLERLSRRMKDNGTNASYQLLGQLAAEGPHGRKTRRSICSAIEFACGVDDGFLSGRQPTSVTFGPIHAAAYFPFDQE